MHPKRTTLASILARIAYKILSLKCLCTHELATPYLSELLTVHNPTRSLGSSDTLQTVTPRWSLNILHKCAIIYEKLIFPHVYHRHVAYKRKTLVTISTSLVSKVSDSYIITLTLNVVLYAALPCLFTAYSTR